jgi:MFS family permease
MSESRAPHHPSYLPWVVWGAGLFVYILAVANRSSFGVAGLLAAQRFGVSATVLSLFVVVQLAVYAGMQLPAGMALDVWGPRRLLVIGAIAMSIGQLAMALVPSVQLAIVARVLIGAGDATVFVSAVRLVWDWFPREKVSLLTQLTGLAGQAGQIVSAIPFAMALRQVGWVPSFLTLAVAGGIAALTAGILVKRRALESTSLDTATPLRSAQHDEVTEEVDTTFTGAMRHPSTWLGFFAHMLCGVGTTVFVLMWGVPFMVEGEGYSPNVSSILLVIVVLTSVIAAPLIGRYTSRNPNRRSTVTLWVGALVAIGWLIALVPAVPLPFPIFIIAVILISAGGPASLIGLDLAGSFNSPGRRSTVQGIANMGGFVAAIAVMLTVGSILDHRTGGATPVLNDYRAALSVVFIPMALATIGLFYFRHHTRKGAGIKSSRRFRAS